MRDQSGPIQIALIAPTLNYVGGQAVQADLLRRYWESDPAVEVKFIPIDPEFPSGLGWLKQIPVLRTIVREPLYLACLWAELKSVEVAHIFSASYWSFWLAPAPAAFLAHFRGKKVLVHYHSGEARDHIGRFRGVRWLLARAGQLVVPSQYLVDVFAEFRLCAREVPNIADWSQFLFRERVPLRPHLICTRGFHPYYCVDVVLRAFAEVQGEFPDARLDLLGGGPCEPQIRRLAEQLNLSNVNFSGVASRDKIGDHYDAADIFINASRLDNMPVSILEAFAAGLPVVSTNPEGMRYVVEHEHTGLLSEIGDAAGLARNVIRLLRDPELSFRVASAAHERSRAYRWSAVRPQWLAIYSSLCQSIRVPNKDFAVEIDNR